MISPWTIPGIELRLMQLHALKDDDELTMQQIADTINAEFGTTFTRNAIIGRSRRLLLPKRPLPLPPKREKTPMQQEDHVEPQIPQHRLREGVTFFENTGCKWPHGPLLQRAELFCGKPIDREGGSWCEEHHHKVYTKRKAYA